VIFDVLVPALLMLSPFAILARPHADSRRRRVPRPVGLLGVMAARWRGRHTIRRIDRARCARARAHRGRHRAEVVGGAR
jgi:hypothetical protein